MKELSTSLLASFKIIYNICFVHVIFFSCTRRINLYIMRLRRYTSYRWQEKFPRVLLFFWEKSPGFTKLCLSTIYQTTFWFTNTHVNEDKGTKNWQDYEKQCKRLIDFGDFPYLVYKFSLVNKTAANAPPNGKRLWFLDFLIFFWWIDKESI